MVFLKYDPYGNYQKDAELTNFAMLINSTSQNIVVSPEVDYVFQFSIVDKKSYITIESKITIFKTLMVKPLVKPLVKPEIEIPKWMKK